jgi:hypothetical protein
MATYLFAYTGGSTAQGEDERAAAMAAWGTWLSALGDAVVEAGNPFGPSATVAADGGVTEGAAAGLSGYSLVRADSLAAATTLTKGCPVLAGGGAVQVYEAIPVM